MPLKKREVEGGLERKGFEKTKETHHIYFRYVTMDGVRTSIQTYTSHGSSGKEIGNKIISHMARQCSLSTRQFRELISCELSRESYEQVLDLQGKLS